MLDNTFNQSIAFNSVAGTLVKSCQKSKFARFHMNSAMANFIFDTEMPRLGSGGKEIQILQVMLCGGDQFLAEYVECDLKIDK